MNKKYRIYIPWLGLLLTAVSTVLVLTDHSATALIWSALLVITLDAALLRGQIKKLINRERTRENQGGYAPFPITIRGGEWAKVNEKGLVKPWIIKHVDFQETDAQHEMVVETVVLGIDRITPIFARSLLHARGYRGATPQEFAAFTLKYPESGLDSLVLAVGEMIVPKGWIDSDPRVLGYGRVTSEELGVVCERATTTYSVGVKFLAIPLDS